MNVLQKSISDAIERMIAEHETETNSIVDRNSVSVTVELMEKSRDGVISHVKFGLPFEVVQ